jgi:ketol-acid reductoisomerase
MSLVVVTDTVSVYRLTRTGNKEGYGGSPVLTGLACQIIPASTEVLAIYGGNPSYALFEVCFDADVTIRSGDKLVSEEGVEYIVRDVPMPIKTPYLAFTKAVAEVVL